MLRYGLALFAMLVLSLFSLSTQAEETTTTVVTKQVVVSPAPQAACTTVAAHWEGGTWVDTHNVCKYENRPEGVAWVNDYWSCTAAQADGTCTSWALVPGHWIKSMP